MAALAARRTSTTVTAVAIALPLLVGLAWLTLAPRRIEQRAPEFVSVVLEWMSSVFGSSWGTLGVADFAANLAVFVPVGLLAYLILPRRAWVVAILVGPALSGAVELIQFLFLPERVAALSDVVAATIGAALGVGIAALCTVITARRS
jgi:glycopeptide antibiotics resistance protein